MKTKFENKWLFKSLESLENDYWGEPEYDSHLVTTCHRLRKKQLKDFDTEDLRIMIGQNFSLKYLIPLALAKLTENIVADGDLYKGDLLEVVLKSDRAYWKEEQDNWTRMCNLVRQNKDVIENDDTSKRLKQGWFDSFAEFEKIN